MDFQFASLLTFSIILCIGVFVQSAAGFAAGLLIIPALLWFGLAIPEAQASLLVATIPQNVWGVYKFHASVDRREILLPAILRLSFLPVGMGVLVLLEALPPTLLRQIVGAILLLVTLAIACLHPRPRARLHQGWSMLAFSVSGFLQGLVGMGGPAMVLWVQAHDWDTRRSRGFLFSMYLVSLAPAMLGLSLLFGNRILIPSLATALLTPLLLWITSLGLRFGTWLGRRRLRRATLAMLLLMGLTGVVEPFISRRPTPAQTAVDPAAESSLPEKSSASAPEIP